MPNPRVSSSGSIASRAERQTRARVALRVNPDIDARSHPHISTGLKTNKFGIAARRGPRDLPACVAARRRSRSSGSTSTSDRRSPTSIRSAGRPQAIVTLARELRDDGITIDHLDLGGGLGVSYDGSPVPSAQDYAAALLPVVAGLRPGHRPRARTQHRRSRGRAPVAGRRRQGSA